jgi:hypothetical protein
VTTTLVNYSTELFIVIKGFMVRALQECEGKVLLLFCEFKKPFVINMDTGNRESLLIGKDQYG